MVADEAKPEWSAEDERAFWEGVPDFRDVIYRLMEDRGIESVEELHRRVVESGYGGIDRYDRNTSLWRFEMHVNGETGALSERFVRALDYSLSPPKRNSTSSLRRTASRFWVLMQSVGSNSELTSESGPGYPLGSPGPRL